MTLARLSLAALLVAPVRIALGLVGLGIAVALDEDGRSAVLAFAIGAFGTAFALVADRRGGILAQRSEPEPAPADASFESRLMLVRKAMMPSTVGVSVLAAIAFAAGQPGLGALLAGAVAGMGLTSLFYGAVTTARERASGAALYLDRREGRLYTGAPR